MAFEFGPGVKCARCNSPFQQNNTVYLKAVANIDKNHLSLTPLNLLHAECLAEAVVAHLKEEEAS